MENYKDTYHLLVTMMMLVMMMMIMKRKMITMMRSQRCSWQLIKMTTIMIIQIMIAVTVIIL